VQLNFSVPDQQMMQFAMDDAMPMGVAADDLELTGLRGAHGNTHDLRIATRRRMVYAMMDSTFDMSLLAQALRSVLAINAADTSAGLAVGLRTVLTFNEVLQELAEASVDAAALDFIVCNCGAYIMYMDSEGQWQADEAWEEQALHRWDKKLVVRARLHAPSAAPRSVMRCAHRACSICGSGASFAWQDSHGAVCSTLRRCCLRMQCADTVHEHVRKLARDRAAWTLVQCVRALPQAPLLSALHACADAVADEDADGPQPARTRAERRSKPRHDHAAAARGRRRGPQRRQWQPARAAGL
jgi:hypothetical protein